MEKLREFLHDELCRENNRFAIPFIEKYIEKCDSHTIVSLGIVLINYVYVSADLHKKRIPSMDFVKNIATRINVVLRYFAYEGEPLVFWVLPARVPRKYPNDDELLAPIHINGAYTYRDGRPPRIFVYRCEEMAKVMLHETCHHLAMHSVHWSGTARLCREFGVNNDDNMVQVNEAVVEFWAEILQCCFVATETGKNVATLVKKEIHHGISKTKKLLAHQQKMPGGIWREHTNAFSYIVWRTILLYFYRDFITQHVLPYDTAVVTEFIINKFKDDKFQHALKIASFPRNNNMRMTIYGDK